MLRKADTKSFISGASGESARVSPTVGVNTPLDSPDIGYSVEKKEAS